ncbi:MAG: hypothetical protein AAGI71_12715 [Bacteroidota bacterium]
MPDIPHQRLFSDKEISEVLKRAAELQNSQGSATRLGLTQDELQHAAHEVGIDPQWVQIAIRELAHQRDVADADDTFHLWGAPLNLEVERIVPGELDVDDWGELVSHVRRALNKVGDIDQIGRHLEWRHDGRSQGVESYQFVANPRNGQTRLTLNATFDSIYALFVVLPTSLMVLPIIPIFAETSWPIMVKVAAAVGIVAGTFLAGRWGLKQYVRRRTRRLKKLMRDLVERVQDAIQESAPIQAAAPPVELPSEDVPTSAPSANRTRTR